MDISRSELQCSNLLQLVPMYRSYVVDSLERLSFLDDIPVTVDERLEFSGLSTDTCKSAATNKIIIVIGVMVNKFLV